MAEFVRVVICSSLLFILFLYSFFSLPVLLLWKYILDNIIIALKGINQIRDLKSRAIGKFSLDVSCVMVPHITAFCTMCSAFIKGQCKSLKNVFVVSFYDTLAYMNAYSLSCHLSLFFLKHVWLGDNWRVKKFNN